MAISPPSDIVLDVLRAADPMRAAQAAARLGASPASSMRQADAGAWMNALAAAGKAPARPQAGAATIGIRPSSVNTSALNAGQDSSVCKCITTLSRQDAAFTRMSPETARAQDPFVSHDRKRREPKTLPLQQAYAGLEALLVRQMLENAFSKGGDALFGGGFAGDTWKALMAQSIADHIADAGGLGLAAALSAAAALPEHAMEAMA